MPILHAKSPGNGAELNESQARIQMPCVDIAFHDSIELEHSKSQFTPFFQAIQNQLLPNVLAPYVGGYGITCIADMPTSAHIVWMEDV